LWAGIKSGCRAVSATEINHATDWPETGPAQWHYRPRCGTPGDQRVPDLSTQIAYERAKSWRREIVQARIRLADNNLSYKQRAELWQIVDCREWCLKMLVMDFPQELERIDREIEHELRR
jgi:hypothetical protein